MKLRSVKLVLNLVFHGFREYLGMWKNFFVNKCVLEKILLFININKNNFK